LHRTGHQTDKDGCIFKTKIDTYIPKNVPKNIKPRTENFLSLRHWTTPAKHVAALQGYGAIDIPAKVRRAFFLVGIHKGPLRHALEYILDHPKECQLLMFSGLEQFISNKASTGTRSMAGVVPGALIRPRFTSRARSSGLSVSSTLERK
jgi:hypothetical protein